MREWLNGFAHTPIGRWVIPGIAVVGIAIVVVLTLLPSAPASLAAASRERTYICSETGKSFTGRIEIGGPNVLTSPFSGKSTGYPAELCYWTKEGATKEEPTAVLHGSWLGRNGPTYCPDCDRLVVMHNPPPVPGATPPPTRGQDGTTDRVGLTR